MEKSYVGIARCFYCLKDSVILLDTRLRNSLPRDCGVVDMEPCSEYEKHMKNGIILIGATLESLSNIESEFEEFKSKQAALSPWEKRNQRFRDFIPNPYRNGFWAVVTDDYIKRAINNSELINEILTRRWTFIDEETCKLITRTDSSP